MQVIVARAAPQCIIAAVPKHGVIAIPRLHKVIAAIARDLIAAARADNQVIPGGAGDHIAGRCIFVGGRLLLLDPDVDKGGGPDGDQPH